jgi:cell division protein FtsB
MVQSHTPVRPQRGVRPPRQRGASRTRVRWSLNEFIEREIERSGVVITGIIIVIAALVNLVGPIQIWFEQQLRISELHAEVSKAKATLVNAQSDLARWKDRAYIETQARQRLMYVYPGDISYLIVNDVTAKPAKSNEVVATVQATNINWVDAFLESYAFAATSTVTEPAK